MGPKYERPDIESPEQFRAAQKESTDSVLNLKWWELFDDPVLDSLVKAALENNKDLLIASSRIEQSRANLGIQRADFYPQLQGGGGVMTGNYAGGLFIFEDQLEALNLTGQLNWEIDFWGRIRRSTEAAKADLLADEFGKRTVQISIISEVVKNYFQLLDYQQRLEIAEKTYASRDSAHQIFLDRFAEGIIPEIDVNQSEIQLSISQAAIPSYKRLIVRTENNLSILLGQNPDSIPVKVGLFEHKDRPEIPAGLPSTILNRRPDVLSAEARLHAQTARIGIAQASRMPSFNITGLLGYVSRDLSNFNAGLTGWNASASLFGPIFEFGKNRRRVDVERERTKQVLNEYEKTILQAFAEVEFALTQLETLEEELEARERQYKAAQNAEILSIERYNAGVSSYLEVLENQRSSFDAELTYSSTYQQFLSAHILLYKALGGGWITEEEMQQADTENKE